MAILTVGPGQQFSTIAAAAAAASSGDTIKVQAVDPATGAAVTYTNDFLSINKTLTLQAVGGIVKMVATIPPPNQKGIITEGAAGITVTINGFDISGATGIPDHNAAGIRYEGGNLILNNVYIHNNDDGLLANADPNGTITIDNSEFAFNGFGDGLSHNLYVNKIASLTVTNSYFHDANVGHEIKSRALNTTITGTRILDLNSTASYSIDLPNGGNALIQNNVIQQGPNTDNSAIIAYGEEGLTNPGTSVTISGNTIVNERAGGTFLSGTSNTAVPLSLENNAVYGLTAANFSDARLAVSGTTFFTAPLLLISANPGSFKQEGDAGSTAFTFTVTRIGSLSGTASVNYAALASSAANSADFLGGALPSGTVNFAAGVRSQTITINVAGDTVAEPDEQFTVQLSAPVGAILTTVANPSASATILNDDGTPSVPSLSIATNQASKPEGNGGSTPFTFTVTRSGDLSGASSASYAVTGVATASDFVGSVLPSGTVSFAANQASATVTVNVAGDTIVEPDESFTVTLSNPTGATIATATASSTILNDDALPPPSLSIATNQASKPEGNGGSTPFTFTVTRSGDLSGASSASYAVTGVATASDFVGSVLPSGTVSFAANQASATVTVNVAGDTIVEPDESFTVTLSNPTGATIATATASSTILNDDALPPPSLSIATNQVSKPEGNGGSTPFTFTVTRSGDLSGASSASYAVTGVATASDFVGSVLPSGTVSFAANQASATVTVNVAGDTIVEPDESFTVTLSNPTGATIATATASSTILNDDALPPPSLSIATNQASKPEGNGGSTPFTFTVTRSGDLSGASSASYAVTGVATASDFVGSVLPSGTVSFAANQASATVTVNVAGDTIVEPDESFTVTLSNPTGATIATATASSTILNDDALPPPSLSIATNQASKPEGNGGSTPFTFTVTRSGDLSGASSASYAVTGVATASDFVGSVLPSGTVSFAANQASATVTVNVAGDTIVEPDESFTVTLSNPTGATIATATASSTILNDDALPPPSLSIATNQASKPEGNGGSTPFTFTVTRSGDLSGASSASYAVTGVATASDFVGSVLPSGTVSFAANQASATVTVNVAGDTIVEPDESFTVTLSNPTGATIATATASSTILNDDALPPPSLSIATNQASKPEGNGGSTPFTFTVTRSGDLSGASSASYAVTGVATASDFVGSVLPSGTVSFAANQASATVTVNVAGDTIVEPDESFTVTLSNPTGATIATATASSTILNDDALPPPSLSIATNQASKPEGNGGSTPFTFTVTRSGDLSGASSASYAVTGVATASDFVGSVLPSGTVSFAANQASATVTVNVAGDTIVEPDESFTVTLSNPTGATIATATASSTILNDDALPPPSLSIATNQASKPEGNGGSTPFTFTVTRSGDLSGASSASYAVTGVATASDFVGSVLPSGTVSFAANQASATVTVNVAGDTIVEPDESFTVTLSNPTGATIATATASSTILNDDALPPPSLSIATNQASKPEGNGGSTPFTFTVTRSGDLSGASSASYAVTGVATASDFVGSVLPSGTVSFAANQASATVTVNVAGDTIVEPDESFTVTLSNPTGATIATATASSTILNDESTVVLHTIGDAGPYSRANPDAWHDAWLKDGVFIIHRQNYADATEPWQAANFGTSMPGTYGGSDIAVGNLGVAGRTTGVQPTPQEIDGTEALRFAFSSAVSVLDFSFAHFDVGDRARIDTYDANGSLVGSQIVGSPSAGLTGLAGVTSVVVSVNQGTFDVHKLAFG